VADHRVQFDQRQELLENQPADETEREEREAGQHLEILNAGRHVDVDERQQPLESVADHHRQPDHRDMQRQRVDRVAADGLEPGMGTLVLGINADPFRGGLLFEGADVANPAAADGEVDHRHAENDAEHHAHRRDGVAERDALRPAEVAESSGQPGDGAVAAFEPDFQQVAERDVDAEERDEHDKRQPEPGHILTPGDELPHAELGSGFIPDGFEFRDLRTDEKRSEDDVDQEAGEGVPVEVPVRRGFPAERRVEPDQPEDAADDRRGQVEPLEERNRGSYEFPEYQQKTESAKGHYHRFHSFSFLLLRSGVPCAPFWFADRTRFLRRVG